MIEQIQNIGRLIRTVDGEKSLVQLWTKDSKPVDILIIIDVDEKSKKVTKQIIDFYPDVYIDSLLYQQGNGQVGAGIKVENYKSSDSTKIKDKKVLNSIQFMEIDEKYLDDIWKCIEEEIIVDIKKSYFIMITKNGKKPIELYNEKYESKIKDTYLRSDKLLQKKNKF